MAQDRRALSRESFRSCPEWGAPFSPGQAAITRFSRAELRLRAHPHRRRPDGLHAFAPPLALRQASLEFEQYFRPAQLTATESPLTENRHPDASSTAGGSYLARPSERRP